MEHLPKSVPREGKTNGRRNYRDGFFNTSGDIVGEARIMMDEQERITFRVPTGMKQKLDKRIEDEDLYFSRSELIRHLLQNFLSEPYRRKDKRLRR